MSGVNLMLPAASTLLDTVTMAARAAILPAGVSTVTSRLLQPTRLAGVDSASGTCSPSLAISVPRPWRQAIAALRSCARALSIAERSFRSLPVKLAPSTNSAAPAQSPRSFGSTEAQATSALPREASSMARLARTRAARNSSVSPARALRRPMRIFWPAGAAATSSPAARAELDHRVGVGIVHPARAAIERHVEGRGIGEAAAADLARGLHHDHLAVRRHDAPRRGDAGSARRRSRQCQPRAAAARPMRGRRAPASPQAPRTPTGNPGASLSCHGFRNF